MTDETPIITQLRETINRAENMVPFMRGDMIQLLEGAKCKIETLTDNLKQMQKERDEARREICEYQPRYYGKNSVTIEAEDAAERRGWDCYKETP